MDETQSLIQDLRFIVSGSAASHEELRELCRRSLMTLSALNPDVPVDTLHNAAVEGARIISIDGRYPNVKAFMTAISQDVDASSRSAFAMIFDSSGKFRARYYNLSTFQLCYIGGWCTHESVRS